jgi:hypothetical protein
MESLAQVKKVEETIEVQELNKFLALGWTLINTTPYTDESGKTMFLYCMGWSKDGEPEYPQR